MAINYFKISEPTIKFTLYHFVISNYYYFEGYAIQDFNYYKIYQV